MSSKLNKRIDRAVGSAIHDWQMISENDRILVGISGGKDSQSLLKILFSLQKRSPVKFELLPVHIDAGFEGSFAKNLEQFIKTNYLTPRIVYRNYGVLAHSDENKENPCFLCSRLRRKKLFEIAKEEGCKKIALGHNKDDIIETLFINICYSGRIGTMKPSQSFFNGVLDIIRPLSYVEKKDILKFSEWYDLPVYKNNCPSANITKRIEIRQMLETLYKHNTHIKGNIFRSMSNIELDYLLKTTNSTNKNKL